MLRRLKIIDAAFKNIELLLLNLIRKRDREMRKSIEMNEDMDESIKDVFGRLVLSQVQNGAKLSLSDREIIGNSFVFLFAGHGALDDLRHERAGLTGAIETTAHTLSATLAMLALHEDEQEHVFRHIEKVLPDDRAPVRTFSLLTISLILTPVQTFEDYDDLDVVLATFHEALRLYRTSWASRPLYT